LFFIIKIKLVFKLNFLGLRFTSSIALLSD